jgi:voltage-gated sodium channel
VLLVGNFVANAFEAQIRQDLMDEDGNPTPIKIVLEKVDVGFTTVFTAELMINMYAHLWWDFVSNGWCIFDFLVIAVSLITIFGEGLPAMPITIFRLVRTFRVLRLFGRLESIRSIINALSASLLPVMNVFFIMFIVLALYAILGVTLFSEMAPGTFGNLSLAIIELFCIAAGETWISEVPEAYEEGNVNWGVGL